MSVLRRKNTHNRGFVSPQLFKREKSYSHESQGTLQDSTGRSLIQTKWHKWLLYYTRVKVDGATSKGLWWTNGSCAIYCDPGKNINKTPFQMSTLQFIWIQRSFCQHCQLFPLAFNWRTIWGKLGSSTVPKRARDGKAATLEKSGFGQLKLKNGSLRKVWPLARQDAVISQFVTMISTQLCGSLVTMSIIASVNAASSTGKQT